MGGHPAQCHPHTKIARVTFFEGRTEPVTRPVLASTVRAGEPVILKESSFSKVKTYLDSGANEFLLKDRSLAKNIKNIRTVIETAGGGKDLKATSAGQVDFLFSDLRTPVPMGAEFRRALWRRATRYGRGV